MLPKEQKTEGSWLARVPKSFDGFELVDIGPDLDMINAAMRNVHFKGLQYKKFEEQSKPHLDKVAAYMTKQS